MKRTIFRVVGGTKAYVYLKKKSWIEKGINVKMAVDREEFEYDWMRLKNKRTYNKREGIKNGIRLYPRR